MDNQRLRYVYRPIRYTMKVRVLGYYVSLSKLTEVNIICDYESIEKVREEIAITNNVDKKEIMLTYCELG